MSNVPSYYNAQQVVQTLSGPNGTPHTIVDPRTMQDFQMKVEGQLSTLTVAMQSMAGHINWIEPRLHEFINFNKWMEQAHPDIIDAYKKSTAVVEVLDKANNTEMEHIQVEVSA